MSDKGGGLVALKKSSYLLVVTRHLSYISTYEVVDVTFVRSSLSSQVSVLRNLIVRWDVFTKCKKGEDQFVSLWKSCSFAVGTSLPGPNADLILFVPFSYGLPKVHKFLLDIRHVVAAHSIVAGAGQKLVDAILNPVMRK